MGNLEKFYPTDKNVLMKHPTILPQILNCQGPELSWVSLEHQGVEMNQESQSHAAYLEY